MTKEIQIKSFKILGETCKNAMSIVAAADYKISLKDGYELDTTFYKEKMKQFYEQEEILVNKKSKKNERELDIKPYIYDLSFEVNKFKGIVQEQHAEQYANGFYLYMELATGSVVNIKPDLVLEAFAQYIGMEWNKYMFQIHRMEVYAQSETEGNINLHSLESFGADV